MQTFYLYRLCDATGKCRYVGATAKPALRKKQHSRKGFTFAILRQCQDKARAATIESQIIRAFKRRGECDLNSNSGGGGRPCEDRVKMTVYTLPKTLQAIRRLREPRETLGDVIDRLIKISA